MVYRQNKSVNIDRAYFAAVLGLWVTVNSFLLIR